MIAAPSPCAARAAISARSVGATAHSADALVKSAMPGEQQPAAAREVTQPPDADDQVVLASR